MRLLLSNTILAGLLLASASSFAADFTPGVYLGTAIGRASASSAPSSYDSKNSPAFGVDLGYQFNPNLGVEVFARSLNFSVPFSGLFGDSNYYPDSHVGISVLGTLPLDQHFSLYGRAGIGRTNMTTYRQSRPDYKETDPTLGAGISYAFNRNWSINLEATRFTKTDVTTGLFGFRYSF